MGGCGNCGTCGCCMGFTELTEESFACTLMGGLVGTVDAVRDIATQLGARAYIVSLLWTRWSGGERGVGYEEVVANQRILPTPLVSSLDQLDQSIESIGTTEVGSLKVTEISPRYSEDYLNGSDVVVPAGQPIPADVSFSWVVTFLPAKIQRRFVIDRVLNYDAENMEWEVTLIRSQDELPRAFSP